MAYRQYTHCVQPTDYVDPLPRTSNALQVIGAIVDGLLGGWLSDAILGCDYLLGGKLVCLGGDECAIGRITHFEPPSSKSFPANLDNDFSLNIVLAPQGLGDFTFKDPKANFWHAEAGPQGRLLTQQQQPGMPIPHEDETDEDGEYGIKHPPLSDRFLGYYSDYPDSRFPEFDPSHSPFQVPGSDGPPFAVPALHLEAEGDRVSLICGVLAAFTGGSVGRAVCSIPIIGFVVCHVLGLLLTPLLPVLATAIAAAWASARDGNIDDPRTGDSGGELHFGDLVVATGRWVYDAGHKGWNEFHPVKTIQRISESSYDEANFDDLRNRWCNLLTFVLTPRSTKRSGRLKLGISDSQAANCQAGTIASKALNFARVERPGPHRTKAGPGGRGSDN
jgi:hypothetical protein